MAANSDRPDKIPTNIADEMRQSYMDYAMSVIIGRALPDVRDGLKPANRRVLYGMQQMGLQPGRPYRKCAKIVGRGDGQLPPPRRRRHLRHPRAHGPGLQHARAPRGRPGQLRVASTATRPRPCATPRRASPASGASMMADIEKDTVDFQPTYDDSSTEPTVLPTVLPEPARERRGGHRGGHGHQHPAPQPGRGRGRRSSSCSRTPTSRPTSGWKG